MKSLLLVISVLALAGCAGGDDGDVWGGYTESEAKEILADPNVKNSIIEGAPGDPATSQIPQLYPTKEEIEESDLRKVTYQGQEGWQWQHPEQDFCIIIYEEEGSFVAFVSRCIAD